MSELRKDLIIGRWVIISTERGKRPSDYNTVNEKPKSGFCPFCMGNEDKTPEEILAYRPTATPRNSPGWTLRVVPNKFPALVIEGELGRVGVGMFDKMNGIGAHEVIIETPEHNLTLSTMSLNRVEDVFWAYRDRILDLKKDRRFHYILIFKNHGEAVGASLEHTHSQLIALPIVPKWVMEETNGSKTYYEYKERCVYCDIIHQEIEFGVRVIAENKDFIAICPFASRFPFETWIMPKSHDSSFENAHKQQYEFLSMIFQETLRRLDKALANPPFNYLIHTSPISERFNDYYHWHIEIMPKLTQVAGFEWGTGFYINPTAPEEAARFLREAKI